MPRRRGGAPSLSTHYDTFQNVDPNFTVYYLAGSSGFTSPTWNGLPAVEIDPATDPSGYWLAINGYPHDTNLKQDLNGDGVDLLMAYALNLDPNSALAGMPVPIPGPGTLSMTFYGAAQGVTYGAETSTDLQNWGADGVTLSDPDPDGMRTATIDTTAPRRFMRLVVDEE